MATYTYTPLSPGSTEIRLLTLQPGAWEADLECHLHHARLDENPSYEALSYTWGDAKDTAPILLGGSAWSVTKNLQVALRYLRLEEKERVMWIDALCINQLDLKERDQQVTRMSDIYISAQRVLAWTGEPGEDGYAAMDVLEKLGAIFNNVSNFDFGTFTLDEFRKAGMDEASLNWNAFISFLERPYWKRVWVVQELAACGFGPKSDGDAGSGRGLIVCGSRSFPKGLFDLICILLRMGAKTGTAQSSDGSLREPELSLMLRSPVPAMGMCATLVQLDNARDDLDTSNIIRLMHMTRNFQATDLRDKIYALLGLSRQKSLVIPDYSRLPETVLADFIKAVIQHDSSLLCLTYNRQGSNTFGPSWIPDLNGLDIGVGPAWQDQELSHRADGGMQADVLFQESRLLLAKGVSIGPITVVIGPFTIPRLSSSSSFHLSSATTTDGESLEIICQRRMMVELEWLEQIKQYAQQQLSSADEFEQYWRTVVMDTDYSNIEHPILPAPKELGEIAQKLLAVPQNAANVAGEADETQIGPDFLAQVNRLTQNVIGAIVGRCFFRTSCGRMGLGSRNSKVGDVVTVLFGACRPIVLRPKDSSTYELVGDSYVYGVMNGELVKEFADGDVSKAETFCYLLMELTILDGLYREPLGKRPPHELFASPNLWPLPALWY